MRYTFCSTFLYEHNVFNSCKKMSYYVSYITDLITKRQKKDSRLTAYCFILFCGTLHAFFELRPPLNESL